MNYKNIYHWYKQNYIIIVICLLSILICIWYGSVAPSSVLKSCNEHWINQWENAKLSGMILDDGKPKLYNDMNITFEYDNKIYR